MAAARERLARGRSPLAQRATWDGAVGVGDPLGVGAVRPFDEPAGGGNRLGGRQQGVHGLADLRYDVYGMYF